MIADDFNERTVANMEVALQRVCERFPKELASHQARKEVAARLLKRAERGERILKGFTDTAIMAAAVVTPRFVDHRSARNKQASSLITEPALGTP